MDGGGRPATTPRLRGSRIGPVRLLTGDALTVLRNLPSDRYHACITSPPYYGLRDYGSDEQIGLESSPAEYTRRLVEVFREVRRVLRPDGTLWLNIGDGYAHLGGGWNEQPGNRFRHKLSAGVQRPPQKKVMRTLPPGVKKKDLLGIAWQVAVALREDGWWLRQEIIWEKPKAMPTSATDRFAPTHERIFLLAKSERYQFQTEQRKQATVWTIPTRPQAGPHVAPFPLELVRRCLVAGTSEGDEVIDPFGGSGTTGLAAAQLGRKATLIELNESFTDFARSRLADALGEPAKVTSGSRRRRSHATAQAGCGAGSHATVDTPPSKQEAHRARMRAEGLRPIQMWARDTSSVEFRLEAARQAALVAADAGQDELSVAAVPDQPRRGDVVALADGGAGRLGVVIQSHMLVGTPTMLICPLVERDPGASFLRLPVQPSCDLPLAAPAWMAVEQMSAVPRSRLGARVGEVSAAEMVSFERALLVMIGVA